jgi:hypothetical protein
VNDSRTGHGQGQRVPGKELVLHRPPIQIMPPTENGDNAADGPQNRG